jgi:hypothetical protein
MKHRPGQWITFYDDRRGQILGKVVEPTDRDHVTVSLSDGRVITLADFEVSRLTKLPYGPPRRPR